MPVRSMTGFGRGTAVNDATQVTVELSAVNRKQAEVVVSAPRDLAEVEPRIRQTILQEVSRGRVQVSIALTRAALAEAALRVDDVLALALEAEFRRVSALLGRDVLPQVADFMNVPGLLRGAEKSVEAESIWPAVEEALFLARAEFLKAREQEGAALAADLLGRLGLLAAELDLVRERAPGRAARQAELLQKRLTELACPVDLGDERLVKELAIFADRCDISEEMTRLEAHYMAFRNYLGGADAAGRALDFLCQEIHREWNTIGSKAADSDIAQSVVRAKTELEKIREQVQNLE